MLEKKNEKSYLKFSRQEGLKFWIYAKYLKILKKLR